MKQLGIHFNVIFIDLASTLSTHLAYESKFNKLLDGYITRYSKRHTINPPPYILPKLEYTSHHYTTVQGVQTTCKAKLK